MLAITVAPVIIGIFVDGALPMVMLFYFLMGFAVVNYIHSLFFVKIFDKYIPQEDAETASEEEKEIDASVFTNLHPANEVSEELPEKKAPWETDNATKEE